jgi:predicted TIM-barrel fold metal-dependent hydrolase
MKPSEYLASGRYFCSVERHEGADMYDSVRGFLGDDVLMYASDYPHSECQFPETVGNFLKWNMPAGTRAKLMSGNAARLFRPV